MTSASTPAPVRAAADRAPQRLRLACLVLAALLIVLWGAASWRSTVRDAQDEVRTAASLLERHVASVTGVQFAIHDAVRVRISEIAPEAVSGFAFHRFLRSLHDSAPRGVAIGVTAVDGRLLASSHEYPPVSYVGGRDYQRLIGEGQGKVVDRILLERSKVDSFVTATAVAVGSTPAAVVTGWAVDDIGTVHARPRRGAGTRGVGLPDRREGPASTPGTRRRPPCRPTILSFAPPVPVPRGRSIFLPLAGRRAGSPPTGPCRGDPACSRLRRLRPAPTRRMAARRRAGLGLSGRGGGCGVRPRGRGAGQRGGAAPPRGRTGARRGGGTACPLPQRPRAGDEPPHQEQPCDRASIIRFDARRKGRLDATGVTGRINAVAAVHDMLYRADDGTEVDLGRLSRRSRPTPRSFRPSAGSP